MGLPERRHTPRLQPPTSSPTPAGRSKSGRCQRPAKLLPYGFRTGSLQKNSQKKSCALSLDNKCALDVVVIKSKSFIINFPDQEGDEQQDGNRCRHVDNLPRGLDRLEYAEVDDDPCNNEEDEELPADAAHVGDGLGHPKYSLTTTGRDSHRRVS